MPPDEAASGRERVALGHMRNAAEKSLAFTRGRSRADLETDELLALALVRLLEVLGEAARRVSEPTREASPDIPWRQIVGTRDRLIHGYDEVDLDIVWTIVHDELAPLVRSLDRLVGLLDATM